MSQLHKIVALGNLHFSQISKSTCDKCIVYADYSDYIQIIQWTPARGTLSIVNNAGLLNH